MVYIIYYNTIFVIYNILLILYYNFLELLIYLELFPNKIFSKYINITNSNNIYFY